MRDARDANAARRDANDGRRGDDDRVHAERRDAGDRGRGHEDVRGEGDAAVRARGEARRGEAAKDWTRAFEFLVFETRRETTATARTATVRRGERTTDA